MAAVLGRPRAIVTDIEGTTTPIAFVRDVLFPYARARLVPFLTAHGGEPAVADALAEAERLAEGRDVVAALLGWMDADAKVTPLKTLQGLIWDEGYRRGELKGVIYPDVPPVLRRWHAAGVRLYVYSSGSEAAQRLLFGFSEAGDLAELFGGFFDTRVGGKRQAESYAAIARTVELPSGDILFLSDIGEELEACRAAGMMACQLVRPEDGTLAWPGVAQAADFGGVQGLFDLMPA
jgi:enolase-phosphatase E1